jgi:hypothetical protein
MKTSRNRLMLDYKDLPDLKSALGGLSPGDRCSVTFELMVVENSDDSLEGDIEKVEYEVDGAAEDEESGEVETSSEDPVMAAVVKRSDAKKKKASPMIDESETEDDE